MEMRAESAWLKSHCGMDWAATMRPINNLTKYNVNFYWSEQCQQAFDELRERILQNVKLYFIDYSLPIFIRTDASTVGCGAQMSSVRQSSL